MPGDVNENRVLIAAGAKSPEAKLVVAALRWLGVEVTRCDTAAFPQKTRITLRDGGLYLGRKRIDTPRTVYVRGLSCHPLAADFQEDLHTRPHGLIAQCDEKRALLESLLLMLKRRGAKLVNGPRANSQHSQKPWQLDTFQQAGLPIPRWCATNEPQAVRDFARDVGQAIYKPLAGGAPAHWLEDTDLTDARLQALTLAPVLFQEYLEGPSIRAYVVGRRVVAAAEIHADGLDYRQENAEIEPTPLEQEERKLVLAAAKSCGMSFAGVDGIRTSRGLMLLECNPSPMFAAFQETTELEVARPLAELLAGRRGR